MTYSAARCMGSVVLAYSLVPAYPLRQRPALHRLPLQGEQQAPPDAHSGERQSSLVTFSQESNAMRRAYLLAPLQAV